MSKELEALRSELKALKEKQKEPKHVEPKKKKKKQKIVYENLKIFFSCKNITDMVYIGSRLHSNPGQKEANISSGIIPGPRRQINFGLEYSF